MTPAQPKLGRAPRKGGFSVLSTPMTVRANVSPAATRVTADALTAPKEGYHG